MIDFPAELRAGTTLEVRNLLTAYPADAGWTLAVALRGPAAIDLAGVADGSTHVLTATAATTAGWPPGVYAWAATLAKDGEVIDAGGDRLRIIAAVAGLTAPHDGRSHAERVLEAIEAVIEKRATKDQNSYKIANRALERMSVGELLKLRSTYRAEVARERRARKGVSLFGQNVRVRF